MKKLLSISMLLFCLNTRAEEAAPEKSDRMFHVQLEGIPCMMRWCETNTLAVGGTFFGFAVTRIDTNAESSEPSESEPDAQDRLVATLVRGDQTLKLERGRRVDFVEYYATFATTQEQAATRTVLGDTFYIENHFFKFLRVDMEDKVCTVVDLDSGETLLVGKEK